MFSDQMKSLTEDIEASYETRKAAVSALVKETHQSLGNFHRGREKMTSDLKRSLASNKVRRAKDVQKMRAENSKGLKDMSKELTGFLSTAESERRQEFAAWIGEMKDRRAALEKDTAQMLADFRSEHEEIASALKAGLAGETRERIETIHDLMSRFTNERKEQADLLRSELSTFQRSLSQMVGDMMADFSADHRQARAHWDNLSKVMRAKKAGQPVPSAIAEKATSAGKGAAGKGARAEKQDETI